MVMAHRPGRYWPGRSWARDPPTDVRLPARGCTPVLSYSNLFFSCLYNNEWGRRVVSVSSSSWWGVQVPMGYDGSLARVDRALPAANITDALRESRMRRTAPANPQWL